MIRGARCEVRGARIDPALNVGRARYSRISYLAPQTHLDGFFDKRVTINLENQPLIRTFVAELRNVTTI